MIDSEQVNDLSKRRAEERSENERRDHDQLEAASQLMRSTA